MITGAVEIITEIKVPSLFIHIDAMKSDQPYRKVLTKETAMQEFKRGSGSQFETKIVEVFLEILDTKN